MKRLLTILVVSLLIGCVNNTAQLDEMNQKLNQIMGQLGSIDKAVSKDFKFTIEYDWENTAAIRQELSAYNMSQKYSQEIPVRADLPKEVRVHDIKEILVSDDGKNWTSVSFELKPEEIRKIKGLVVTYDDIKALYYVSYPDATGIELKPTESKHWKVVLKDIWQIDTSFFKDRRDQARRYLKQLKGSSIDYKKAIDYKSKIEAYLESIDDRQRKNSGPPASPQDHIFTYRDNLELLKNVDALMDSLGKLVENKDK